MHVKILENSVKFYLPRLEGYSEIIQTIADEYGNMSLIEFEGYVVESVVDISTISFHDSCSSLCKLSVHLRSSEHMNPRSSWAQGG
jgi:hypothetical protein